LSQTLKKLADVSAFSPGQVDCRKYCQLSSAVARLSRRTLAFVYNTFTVMPSVLRFVCDSRVRLDTLASLAESVMQRWFPSLSWRTCWYNSNY